MKRRRVDWAGVPFFRCTDEFRLAEVRFRAGGGQFKSTLTSIAGHIFDFATTPGPKAVAFTPWEAQPSVKLLGEPLRVPTGKRELETLPVAWERLLRSCRHQPGDWQIHDAATAYRVALDDGEYLILAEREGDEFIVGRIEPAADGLFHLAHHDGIPEPLERSVDALIQRRAQQGDRANKRRDG